MCARSQIKCEYAANPGETSSQVQIRTLLARVDELEGMLTNMGGRASGEQVF
jgi:hypothetical protein